MNAASATGRGCLRRKRRAGERNGLSGAMEQSDRAFDGENV